MIRLRLIVLHLLSLKRSNFESRLEYENPLERSDRIIHSTVYNKLAISDISVTVIVVSENAWNVDFQLLYTVTRSNEGGHAHSSSFLDISRFIHTWKEKCCDRHTWNLGVLDTQIRVLVKHAMTHNDPQWPKNRKLTLYVDRARRDKVTTIHNDPTRLSSKDHSV